MLSCIQGVSIGKAKALLSEFKTLSNIIEADEEYIKKVDGIGTKLAENIYRIWRK